MSENMPATPAVMTKVLTNNVTVSNDLNQCRYSLTTEAQKLLWIFACLIYRDSDDFKMYQILGTELAQTIGLDIRSRTWESKMHDIIQQIGDDNPTVMNEKTGKPKIMFFGWCTSAHFLDNGYIEFEFSSKIKPFFIGLKNYYLQYKYLNIMTLKADYSIRIYQLLRQHKVRKELVIPTKEFRYKIGCNGKKHQRTNDFLKYTVQKAINEINENTDIEIHMAAPKIGRSIKILRFDILPNRPNRKKMNSFSFAEPQHARPVGYIPLNRNKNSLLYRSMAENYNRAIQDDKEYGLSFDEHLKYNSLIRFRRTGGGWDVKHVDQLEIFEGDKKITKGLEAITELKFAGFTDSQIATMTGEFTAAKILERFNINTKKYTNDRKSELVRKTINYFKKIKPNLFK